MCLNDLGTNARGVPVETSEMIVVSDAGTGTVSILREDETCWKSDRSGSLAYALATSSKAMPWCCVSAFSSIRDRASATGFSLPFTCQM